MDVFNQHLEGLKPLTDGPPVHRVQNLSLLTVALTAWTELSMTIDDLETA